MLLSFIKDPFRKRYRSLASKKDLANLYSQISSLLAVRDMVGPDVHIGNFRGWAISPDALAEILYRVSQIERARVVEFGAGESTIAIAAVLRRSGGGEVLSFEHDEFHASVIRKRIAEAGLTEYADIRLVPMMEYTHNDDTKYKSYKLPERAYEYDIALVDGPIWRQHGKLCRLAPVKWCLDRAHPGNLVYLDDAGREYEREVIDIVKREYAGMVFDEVVTEKGLVRICKETVDE